MLHAASSTPAARMSGRRFLALSSHALTRSLIRFHMPKKAPVCLSSRHHSNNVVTTRMTRRDRSTKYRQRQQRQYSSTLAVPNQQQHRPELTRKQVKAILLSSAIPMIGFGFMDNFVMITAGSAIDNSLGLHLGLATMTAAAIGQVVSDVAGVAFGDTVSRAFRVAPARLTDAQKNSRQVGRLKLWGAVLGVVAGCTLGASALWIVPDRETTSQETPNVSSNLASKEGIRDQLSRLQEVLKDSMTKDSQWSSHSACCTLYVNDSMGDCIPKSPQDSFVENNKAVASIDLLFNDSNKKTNSAPLQAAREVRTVVCENTICVPVRTGIDDDIERVLGVLKIEFETGSFYSGSEIRDAKRMAQNVGFFLNHMV